MCVCVCICMYVCICNNLYICMHILVYVCTPYIYLLMDVWMNIFQVSKSTFWGATSLTYSPTDSLTDLLSYSL